MNAVLKQDDTQHNPTGPASSVLSATTLKPRKVRGPSKKMIAAMATARAEGAREALRGSRSEEMLGLVMWMAMCLGGGVALGAWLF